MAPEIDAMSIISAAFVTLAGKQILDVGCGRGQLARSLSDRGAKVTGVDPNGESLAVARRTAPAGSFNEAGAQALPFTDHSFDGAVFLNSLHHVPAAEVDLALQEAARVVKPAGRVVVIEPLAEGSLFSVLGHVEDETAVRAAAQEAIRRAVESGTFERLDRVDYLRHEHYEDPAHHLEHIVAVDPARATAVEEHRSEIEAAFLRHAKVDADGRKVLDQPMRADVLKP